MAGMRTPLALNPAWLRDLPFIVDREFAGLERIRNQRGVFVHSMPPLPQAWLGIDKYYFRHVGRGYADAQVSKEYIYPKLSPLEQEIDRYRLWYEDYGGASAPDET